MKMHSSTHYIGGHHLNHLPFFSQQDFTIENVLNEYDTDKDGLINLNEFIGDVRGEGETT